MQSIQQSEEMEKCRNDADKELCNLVLPPMPEAPLPSDCCGNGCCPCVLDLYDREVEVWKKECDRIHSSANYKSSEGCTMISDQYNPFTLSEIIPLTADTNLYRFVLPGNQPLPVHVGQHLLLRWKTPERIITRQYTPISMLNTTGHFDVAIKMYPDGVMSNYIRSWKPLQKVEWRGPEGQFDYKPNEYQRLLLLAAGTGIAPMIQVIQHIVDNEEDETCITLLYCCRAYSDLICKDRLDELSSYWNVTVVYFISSESDDKRKTRYGDTVVYERLSLDKLSSYVLNDLQTRILICGTKSFETDMLKYISLMGLPKENCHKF